MIQSQQPIPQQVYSFKLRGYQPFSGLVLTVGAIRTLLQSIPVDYALDGYRLVRNEAVLRAERTESEEQVETVLRLKEKVPGASPHLTLASEVDLFEGWRLNQQLIAIYLRDDSCLVGIVRQVNRQSFRLQLLSTKGQWLEEDTFLFKRIQIVEVETDYLISLQLLASYHQSHSS
ncbi:hypothetical protein [Hymenobacter sp. BT730]|uniref:hypothetical protein n=1 Tax=Hymenobacter sp. BT730 TaxID=3063332 RepID=UPI0026E0EEC6|nr:hypothetical protein [Hymenobacter sp. BT730]